MLSSEYDEEYSETFERHKYLVDNNPNLNFSKFSINNRNNVWYHKWTSWVMHFIFLGIVKSQQKILSIFSKIFND